MNIKDIIAQAFGIIGFFLMVYSYQEKDNKKFVMIQGIAGFAFFANFILIGALSAALFNIVNFIRGFIFSKNDKKFHKLLSSVALYLVCFAVSLPSVIGSPLQLFLSTLTFFAILTMTFFMWKGNGKHIRYAQLSFGSPAWLIYDIFNFSLGGIMTEVLSMASVVIALIRYGKNGFEEN